MQTVYRVWATLVALAVAVQVAFAGYGAFSTAEQVEGATVSEDQWRDAFGLHAGFGYIVVLAGLVLLIIAAIAGVGRFRVGVAGPLFGLLILQVVLAWVGFSVPAIGALHPVNALLIFGLATWAAYAAWNGTRAATSTPRRL